MDHSEENILDAVLDLPSKTKAETIDTVVASYRIKDLPTGSLIVSRGTCFDIMYHSNDLHCHVSILIWCHDDGSDRLNLHYETGTKPMIFGLDTYLYTHHPVMLMEIGAILRDREYAHKPRQDLLLHPRYLEAVGKLTRLLPLLYMNNHIGFMGAYKYQPLIWKHPTTRGLAEPRAHYYDLERQQNPLAEGLRNVKETSYTCIDVVTLFISLLHEELFQESFMINVDDYDVARLLRSESPVYKLYDREAFPFSEGINTHFRPWNIKYFALMYTIGMVVFTIMYFGLRLFWRFGRYTLLNAGHHPRDKRIGDRGSRVRFRQGR